MADKYFAVSLKRGHARRPQTQKDTLNAMGLTRFGRVVHLKDTPENRGIIYKVVHLVDVKDVVGEPKLSSRARSRLRKEQA